jgi:hypothetical protein
MVERCPDKKISTVTHEDYTAQLRETQRLREKATISQDEATWLGFAEYDHIPRAILIMPDVHYGSLDVDYDLFEEHLRIVKETPNMFVAFDGDMVDNFNPRKYPDGMLRDGLTPQEQGEAMMEILLDLDRRSKLVAITWGNHEEFSNVAGLSVFRNFARDLNAPIFGNGGGVINAVVGGVTYRIGLRHTFWENSSLNKTNAPKRMIQFGYDNLDVAVVGHVHKAGGEMYTERGRELIAITGGTYKLYDKFGKKWGHAPEPAGYTILLHPDQKKIELTRTPQDAQRDIINAIRSAEEEGYVDPYTDMIQKLNLKQAGKMDGNE